MKKCPICNKEYDDTRDICINCNKPLVAPDDKEVYKIGGKGKYSCPKCGFDYTTCEKHIGCAVLIIIFISLGIGLIMIPFLPYDCKCRKCGHKWRT